MNSNAVIFQFNSIVRVTLLKRYKRFLADVRFADGTETTVHCPNTGALTGVLESLPCPAIVSKSDAPHRKYPYTLEAVKPSDKEAWVGIHSAHANKLAAALINKRLLPEIGEFDRLQPEVSVGDSRIDFLLEKDGRKTYIEVKSVTLGLDSASGDLPVSSSSSPPLAAVFPDTVSDRALKHVKELTHLAGKPKCSATMLMIVNRGDAGVYAPAWGKDLQYSRAVVEAVGRGVKLLPVLLDLQPKEEDGTMEVRFQRVLPYDLEFMRGAAEAAEEEKKAQKKKKAGGRGGKTAKAGQGQASGGDGLDGDKTQDLVVKRVKRA